MHLFLFTIFSLLSNQLIQAGYTQDGYTLESRADGPVNINEFLTYMDKYFQKYPQMTNNYVDAPVNITLLLNSTIPKNSLILRDSKITLPFNGYETNWDNTDPLMIGLENMLSSFYEVNGVDASKNTPTTIPNDYYLIIVDKSNGTLFPIEIQNKTTALFEIFKKLSKKYENPPKIFIFILDQFSTQNSINVSNSSISMNLSYLRAKNNFTMDLTRLLDKYYQVKDYNSAIEEGVKNPPPTNTNTFTRNGYTLTIINKSNLTTLPSIATQNQTEIFFEIYPKMAANYENAPKEVTIKLNTIIATNFVSTSRNVIFMNVQTFVSTGNDSFFMTHALNSMLYYYKVKKTVEPTLSRVRKSILNSTTNKSSTSSPLKLTSLQQLMLDTHNNYRFSLAKGKSVRSKGGKMPPATNMNQLKYSTYLETEAKNWAKRCVSSENPLVTTYAQNYCFTYSYQIQNDNVDYPSIFVDCARQWWDEVKSYPSNTNITIAYKGFGEFKEFVQMAWAGANSIGCAMQNCSSGVALFCNYQNDKILNYQIYDSGVTCSKCKSCCKNGLCVVSK